MHARTRGSECSLLPVARTQASSKRRGGGGGGGRGGDGTQPRLSRLSVSPMEAAAMQRHRRRLGINAANAEKRKGERKRGGATQARLSRLIAQRKLLQCKDTDDASVSTLLMQRNAKERERENRERKIKSREGVRLTGSWHCGG